MNEVLKQAYVKILKYADLDVTEDGMIVQDLEDCEPVKNKDGEILYLPYKKHLRDHEGKACFHLFNENDVAPESETFLLYRNYLLFAINFKVAQFITFMAELSTNVGRQELVKNTKLVNYLESLEEMDASIVKSFSNSILPKAIEAKGGGALINFFIKKNGKLNDVNYAATGKTNFVLYNECVAAINKEKSDDYRIYDTIKLRKKDLTSIISILENTFPNIDDVESYTGVTNNGLFRYLNALLAVTYIVTKRMNTILTWVDEDLKDPGLTDALKSDLSWVDMLETVYGLGKEIIKIPNQDNIFAESTKLSVNEDQVKDRPRDEPEDRGRYRPDNHEDRRDSRSDRDIRHRDEDEDGDAARARFIESYYGPPSRRDYDDDRRGGYFDDRDRDRGYRYEPSPWVRDQMEEEWRREEEERDQNRRELTRHDFRCDADYYDYLEHLKYSDSRRDGGYGRDRRDDRDVRMHDSSDAYVESHYYGYSGQGYR